jgi:hypothetical protein
MDANIECPLCFDAWFDAPRNGPAPHRGLKSRKDRAKAAPLIGIDCRNLCRIVSIALCRPTSAKPLQSRATSKTWMFGAAVALAE